MADTDPLNRTTSQQELDAIARSESVQLKDKTEQLPVDVPPATELDEKIKAQQTEEEKNRQMIEESTTFLYCVLFFILFGFGTLIIIGVGALIFYLMDYFASIFDFDLSEYTSYICLILTLLNILMSCVGCWGTYKFSGLKKDTEKQLNEVTEDLNKVGDDLATDNEALRKTLRSLEVEITHFEGENKELLHTLRGFYKTEEKIQKDSQTNVLRKEAETYTTLSQLWSLWKIQETNRITEQIVRITGEYYVYAYMDNDTQSGLNEEQYNLLIRDPSIDRDARKLFPAFDHKVWKREKEGEPILVDEFERICALVYKHILEQNLIIEASQDAQGLSFDVAQSLLQPQ